MILSIYRKAFDIPIAISTIYTQAIQQKMRLIGGVILLTVLTSQKTVNAAHQDNESLPIKHRRLSYEAQTYLILQILLYLIVMRNHTSHPIQVQDVLYNKRTIPLQIMVDIRNMTMSNLRVMPIQIPPLVLIGVNTLITRLLLVSSSRATVHWNLLRIT